MPLFLIYTYIYLLAALGLHCCARAFSGCGEWGLLSSCGPLASRGGGFSCCGAQALELGLSSCGTQAQLLHGRQDLLRLGTELVSPALAGELLTTGPHGKSRLSLFIFMIT